MRQSDRGGVSDSMAPATAGKPMIEKYSGDTIVVSSTPVGVGVGGTVSRNVCGPVRPWGGAV